MENLHAPWRIEYILAPKRSEESDVFVNIANSSDDEENLIIFRDKTCYAVLNRYPYTGGHVLVVPYKKVPDFNGLNESELLELMLLTRRCQNAMTAVMKPDGFNIGVNLGKCAGAGVLGHVHIHIVPRWNGDTNFMPVIAGATVVPEALKEIGARLRAALAR